jgi:hypothetical protein
LLRTHSIEQRLALLLMLKSYQRMGCFPKLAEIPDMVVDFVRRVVELPEGTLPVYASQRSAEHHRALVRKRVGAKYDAGRARAVTGETIRAEAAAKNNPGGPDQHRAGEAGGGLSGAAGVLDAGRDGLDAARRGERRDLRRYL